MHKVWAETKMVLGFAVAVFTTAISRTISTSQNILTYILLALSAAVIISSKLFPQVIRKYLSPLESAMNVDWWQLSLMALGGIVLLRLLLAPYLIYRKVKGDAQNLQEKLTRSESLESQSQLELMELRRRVREKHGDVKEIATIPKILEGMLHAVNEVYDAKKGKRQDDNKLWEVYLEFLNIDRDDPYLIPEHFNNPIAIRKSMKYFYKKLGLDTKENKPKLEKQLRRRITRIMDDDKIGLDLQRQKKYQELYNQLERKRMPIAGSLVDFQIDNFVEDLVDLYSFRLMNAYGKTERNLYLFPQEMRDALRYFADNMEKYMRFNYGKVKHTLEMFAIGGDVSVK